MDSTSRNRLVLAACTPSNGSLARLVGRRLRELRNSCGWGQAELEARLDGHIGRSEISYLENGRRQATLSTLSKCAGAFGVEPAVLLLDPRNDVIHRLVVCVLGGQSKRCLQCASDSVRKESGV